jgi:hypothetical protein
VVEERTKALLAAGLEDPSMALAYEESRGVCHRHARGFAGRPAHSVITTRLCAGLGVLAWELGEAGRKVAWPARHEPAGAEATAWLRVLAQLDGRVFLGLPGAAVEDLIVPRAPVGERDPS